MAEIIILPLLELKLERLIFTLFKREYFGSMESAIDYVQKIKETIYSIPTSSHKRTKNPKFGHWYVTHKSKNKRTQYKITFDKKDTRYLVKNIFTSYESGYSKYILGE